MIRELYEKAAELSSTEDRNERLRLQRLIYGCLPELLAVAEAAEEFMNWYAPEGENNFRLGPGSHLCDALRAALRALKEKEGKV